MRGTGQVTWLPPTSLLHPQEGAEENAGPRRGCHPHPAGHCLGQPGCGEPLALVGSWGNRSIREPPASSTALPVGGVHMWHFVFTQGPIPWRDPPGATPGMFPSLLSLDPLLDFSQLSGLARVRVNKLGAPTRLEVTLPTFWAGQPGIALSSRVRSWAWLLLSLFSGLLALGSAGVLAPARVPSPSPHSWAPLSPIS